MLCLGIALWIAYGWQRGTPPVWIDNFVAGCFASVVLVIKLLEPAGTKQVADS